MKWHTTTATMMTTTTNNKLTAAATAIPTIPAKLMPEVAGTGVADEETAGVVVDKEIAGTEVEGKATSVGEEEGGAEMEVEVACAEDEEESTMDEESIMDEDVGIGNPAVDDSDNAGVVSVGVVSPTDVTVKLSSK